MGNLAQCTAFFSLPIKKHFSLQLTEYEGREEKQYKTNFFFFFSPPALKSDN